MALLRGVTETSRDCLETLGEGTSVFEADTEVAGLVPAIVRRPGEVLEPPAQYLRTVSLILSTILSNAANTFLTTYRKIF